MYSPKENLQQSIELLLQHGITSVVLSPGSRNAPLAASLSAHPAFTCYAITDERSAAFFALGLILHNQKPAAVCCTSGTALLNYAPAIAEAYYQQLPLLILSADRPTSWIGQRDGQTIPQENPVAHLLRKAVTLPEPHDYESRWYCNRLLNEALLALQTPCGTPVQINIPISEPLFDLSATEILPQRVIRRATITPLPHATEIVPLWNRYTKRMIVVGQSQPDPARDALLQILATQKNCVVIAEHLANLSPQTAAITHAEELLYAANEDQRSELAPELLLTIGGHIVSKRLKNFLRQHKPLAHWQVTPEDSLYDTYQSLTLLIPSSPASLLSLLCHEEALPSEPLFKIAWQDYSRKIETQIKSVAFPYGNLLGIQTFLKHLPRERTLFCGNSSSIRDIQLFTLPAPTTLACNRGTSGIEGTLSTAVGYAASAKSITYLVIGDLSFFYDVNGLWNRYADHYLRILLLNNATGGIFHRLPGLNQWDQLDTFVAGGHTAQASLIAESSHLGYCAAHTAEELPEAIAYLTDESTPQSRIVELFSDIESDTQIYRTLFKSFKINP